MATRTHKAIFGYEPLKTLMDYVIGVAWESLRTEYYSGEDTERTAYGGGEGGGQCRAESSRESTG